MSEPTGAAPATFRMPSLGADMEYGTILEWLVAPGDTVRHGDIVAVVKTDKADIEVEIFDDGVIGDVLVPVGEEVEVGTPLATVLTPGAVPAPSTRPVASAPVVSDRPVPEPEVAEPEVSEPEAAESVARRPVASPPAAAAARSRRVSPRARRLAAEHGVDIARVESAGTAVTGADVERAPGVPQRVVEDQPAAMRRAIAAAMSKSNREIPHYHLLHHTPLSHTLSWLEHRNASRSVKERVLPAALFARAVVVAVERVPGLNGLWVDDAFRPNDDVHLGFAISMRGGGLIAPAVLGANHLDLDGLMAAIRDLTSRVRSGRLRGREMTDATITVTNLGDRGVEVVHGVIYPPQVALVGFGTVVTRPWADDDGFAARPVVAISLAGDHRASDGHLGALYVAEIDRLLRNPEEL